MFPPLSVVTKSPIGSQLHFAPQFCQNEDFSVHDIAFLDANFLTK